MRGTTIQGRIQLTKSGQFTSTGRNCRLFSAASGSSSETASTMTVGSSLGSDCTYSKTAFSSTTTMYSVYAHTADQCCKACTAAKGCAGAEWVDDGSAYGPGGGGPQPYEGFGLHLVNVQSSKTTGGIDVATLEAHFTKRLGDMSHFDAFMDYNVVLFAGEDLPSYAQALAKDKVDFLTGTWTASSGAAVPWYSLIVHVPGTQMVIELVSKKSPGLEFAKSAASLEARLSPRQVSRFASASANGILQAVAVTRPCSNMTAIDEFYTNAIGAKTVHRFVVGAMGEGDWIKISISPLSISISLSPPPPPPPPPPLPLPFSLPSRPRPQPQPRRRQRPGQGSPGAHAPLLCVERRRLGRLLHLSSSQHGLRL